MCSHVAIAARSPGARLTWRSTGHLAWPGAPRRAHGPLRAGPCKAPVNVGVRPRRAAIARLIRMQYTSFSQLQVTNQCALVCDLRLWSGPASLSWAVVSGTQDDVGAQIARLLREAAVRRLDDFGGVAETLLCQGEAYLPDPPRVREGGAIYSFTPKKRFAAEGLEMARVSAAAGYALMILTVQKHDRFGKVWVLCGALRHLEGPPITYYEDTNTLIDELKVFPEGVKLVAVHVKTPGFEEHVSLRADRAASQSEYQRESLLTGISPRAA